MNTKLTFLIPVLVVFISFQAFGQLKSFELPQKEHIHYEDLRAVDPPQLMTGVIRGANSNYIDRSEKKATIVYPHMEVVSRTPEGRPTFILFEDSGNNSLVDDETRLIHDVNTELERVFQTQLNGGYSTTLSTEIDGAVAHIKLQQLVGDIPVYSGEYFIHLENGVPSAFNGNIYDIDNLNGSVNMAKNQDEIRTVLDSRHFANTEMPHNLPYILENKYELIYYPSSVDDDELDLAYYVEYHPSFDQSYTYFIDAITGEVLNSYSNICKMNHDHSSHISPSEVVVADGPKSGTARDLHGINRTLEFYEVGGLDLMIDVTRDMYAGGTVNHNDPQGAIWTIDGGNKYPGNSDFEAKQLTSINGFKSAPDAISAYYNASESYEYFLSTFGRNSIDGKKGSIISFINISDEDGRPFDNAFWNGAAMFYGSGNQAFEHLAKALDVGGHEMTHGVIQASSNLEYQDEPGALNESLADVFGVMIDREDWQLGEDVTKTSYIATGVLRDMADPHNGGSRLGDPGWQPAHMNEKYTGSQDNGGVHINSGIVNKACYLVGQEMPKSKVEQIFYCAMTKYLTRRSSFADYRAACEQCAAEKYGATEKSVVSSAFAAVGIGSGGTTNPGDSEIEPNPGDDLIINTLNSTTNILDGNGDVVVEEFTSVKPISKPSVSDDGSAIVFVDEQNRIYIKQVDWQQGVVIEEGQFIINDQNGNPIDMRNVCISPDKSRIAFVLNVAENYIYFYDFNKGEFKSLELYNPTFSEDVITGEVKYADAMAFNSSGEIIVYDNYNEISTNTGENIKYWDIAYASIFNNQSGQWTDPRIFSFFGSLPQGTSVGNPALAKNTNDVMTMDVLEEGLFSTENYVATAGLNQGDIQLIFNNTRIGYPSYSRLDNIIIFSSDSQNNNDLNGVIPMRSDRVTPSGPAEGFAIGTWGNWFATGQRSLPTEESHTIDGMKMFPNPAVDMIVIDLPEEIKDVADLEVRIINIEGKIVYSQAYETSEISIKSLPAGTYNIIVSNNMLKADAQFVKLR